MASALKSARDDIATLWAATTPPTATGRGYYKLTGRTMLDGASGHRVFWFEPVGEVEALDFTPSMAVVRYRFSARVRLATSGLGVDAIFDAVADEGVLLMNRVNFKDSWSAGVRYCQATGWERELADSEDIELAIALVVIAEETDGA